MSTLGAVRSRRAAPGEGGGGSGALLKDTSSTDEDVTECRTATPPVHIIAYRLWFEPATLRLPVQLLNQLATDTTINTYKQAGVV